MSVSVRRLEYEPGGPMLGYEARDHLRIMRVFGDPAHRWVGFRLYLPQRLGGFRVIDHNNHAVSAYFEDVSTDLDYLDLLGKLFQLEDAALAEIAGLQTPSALAYLDGAPLEWALAFGGFQQDLVPDEGDE